MTGVIKLWWNREQMDGHSIVCAALLCKNLFPRQYVFSAAEAPPPPRSRPDLQRVETDQRLIKKTKHNPFKD